MCVEEGKIRGVSSYKICFTTICANKIIFLKIKLLFLVDICDGVWRTWQNEWILGAFQIHGILNAVSWGLMFPIGAIIARYMRTFQSADPAWFYLHVFCQVSAYAIGVAGWGTGIKLGSESKGVQYTGHRNIGIALFSLATLQVSIGPLSLTSHPLSWT